MAALPNRLFGRCTSRQHSLAILFGWGQTTTTPCGGRGQPINR
jgi:hypothetical protein